MTNAIKEGMEANEPVVDEGARPKTPTLAPATKEELERIMKRADETRKKGDSVTAADIYIQISLQANATPEIQQKAVKAAADCLNGLLEDNSSPVDQKDILKAHSLFSTVFRLAAQSKSALEAYIASRKTAITAEYVPAPFQVRLVDAAYAEALKIPEISFEVVATIATALLLPPPEDK